MRKSLPQVKILTEGMPRIPVQFDAYRGRHVSDGEAVRNHGTDTYHRALDRSWKATALGCDVHTRFQQIAMLDPTMGEIIERRLEHDGGVAERFYATLSSPARIGIEATINTQWFERMLRRYGHELWIWRRG